MPRISAGTFVRFAGASAREKQSLVRRAIASGGEWPGYRPRDDYWVRLRNSLKRMLRAGDFSGGSVAREVAAFPIARRSEAGAILSAFAAGWPALGIVAVDGPRAAVVLSGFSINCLPHATVLMGGRRLALRFSYGYSTLVPRDERTHLELLRMALRSSGGTPAVLRVRGPTIHVPRRDATAAALIQAEARQLMSLWRANGGPI